MHFGRIIAASLFSVSVLFASTALSQSMRTVTFSGSSADFNVAERVSAAAGNTDYYITFDSTSLYLGAFRTSGSFASDDNFTVYLDTDPQTTTTSGTGTTTGHTYNGVSGTLPFTANYVVHAEQSTQEARIDTASWSTTISGLTYNTGSTWREISIPLSAIGNPDALYLSFWIGQASAIYANAPGADLGGASNPTVTNYFGGFGLSSANCLPASITNLAITASVVNSTPVTGIYYGKVAVNSGSVSATNDFNIAPGGTLTVTGGTLDISGRSILTGGSVASGQGVTINVNGGTLTTSNATNIDLRGECIFAGSAFTYNGNLIVRNQLVPLPSGATSFGSGARMDLRANGSISTNSPQFNSGSTLAYNTGNTRIPGLEWAAGSSSGVAVPHHVVIGDAVANSVVSFGTVSQFRRAIGNLEVSNAYSGNGLTLSSNLGGDLQIGGNFIQNGTFTHNTRSVTMNGSSAQAISGSLNTAGATNCIPVLIINNSSGGVTLNSDLRVTATSGNVLTIQNAGSLNVASGVTLTLEGNGGSILTSGGVRTIQLNAANSAINITGTKTFASSVGGTLSINSAVSGGSVNLTAAVNFGSGVVTIGNNTYLRLNSGGSVTTNAPSYNAGSTLVYNQGGTIAAATEWTAGVTSGAGVPGNVLIGNGVNTTLNFGSSTQLRQTGGSIQISASSALALSTGAGGNLQVKGDFVNSGTFTHNSREVVFNGTAAQELTGATTFYNMTLLNTSGLSLNSDVVVSNVLSMSNGNIILGSSNLTLTNTATGAVAGTFSSSRMIVTNGSGQLIRAIATASLPITYNFPVGDNTGAVEYSPASFTFSANGAARNIGVRAIDTNHSQLNNSPAQTDYLSRYWAVTNSAGSTYTYTPSFTYPAADLNGSELNLRLNMYNGAVWTQLVASSSASNVLGSGGAVSNSSLPLGATAEFTGRVNDGSTYTWNQTGTANFNTASNWTPNRTTPAINDILVFSNNATTTATNVPNQTIGRLVISGTTNVSFTSTADVTLTIAGGNGDDLSIAGGATMQLSSTGGSALTVAFANAPVATINGTLVLNSNTANDNRFNATNSVTTVNGSINSIGVVTGSTTALIFSSGANYRHNFTATAGAIPVATWDAASNCIIQGYTSNTSAPGNLNQTFGNFTWNCTSQGEDINLGGALTSIAGNFTVSSTGGSTADELILVNNTNTTINVGGNMSISGNNTELKLSTGNALYTVNLNVAGSYTQTTGSSILNLTDGDDDTNATFSVGGAFNFNAGTITQTTGGTPSLDVLIQFNGSSTQNINIAGTFSNEIDFRVNNAAGVNLTGTIPVIDDCTFYRTAGTITGGTISYGNANSTLVYDGSAPMTTSSVEWPTTSDPENIVINSTSTVSLHASRTVENDGEFTNLSGVFILGSFDLTLANTSAGALVNASPSATNMIAASGSGQLRRTLPNGARDLYFYIGDVTGTTEYSGFRLNFSANSVNGRIVGVRVVDDTSASLSLPYSPIDFLSRHWIVTLSSTSGSYDYDPSMTYDVAGDVNGTEFNLQVAAFPSGASAWNHYNTSITSPTLTKTGSDLSEGNFNLNNAIFSGRTPVKYWDGSVSSAWTDGNNWTPAGVPGASENIDINGNAINPCILSTTATVNHFTLSDGGDFTMASGSQLTVAGNFTHNENAVTSFDCNSTFRLTNSTFAQRVPALTYGNLFLGAGARILADSDTIRICGNYTPTSGALTTTGSTVDFMGGGAQSILTNNTSFNNLIISNTAGSVNSSTNVAINGNMQVNTSARFNNSAGSLTINSSATANVEGFLRNAGTVVTTGALTIKSTGVYEHNTTTPGSIPTATWDSGSTCELIGNFSNGNLNCGSQAFHHFKVNYTGNGDVNMNETLTTVNGDLTIESTGSGQVSFANNNSVTVDVGGNVVQNGGEWIISSGNNTDVIINVNGNFSQTGGYIDMFSGGGSASCEFRLEGNYSRTGNGEIETTGLVLPNGLFSFTGTTQTITETSSGDNRWVDYVVTNGSTTTLLSNINIWGSASYIANVVVSSGGVLDLDTYEIGGTGFHSTNITSGSKVITAHTDGLAASAAAGSVRTAARIYNSGATYEFDGTSNQNTGNFWTATSTPNSVSNLIINNTASTVTLNSGTDVTVSGTMTFASTNTAAFNVASQTVYVSNNATGAVNRSGLGHVIGNLRRAYTTGANSYVFDVGTTTGYSPASFNLNASAAGSFVVRATDGSHPNMATDGLSQTAYVNRYWTVTYVFGNITSNTSTFTYLPADLVGGATAETLRLKRYSSGWTSPAFTSVVNQLTASGLNNTTTYGDFFAAADCSSFTASITPSGSTTFCNGGSVDLSASSNITGSTYAWSPATGLSGTTGANVTASPTSTQTYTVTATSPQNCVDTETITVTVNSRPTAAVSGSTSICAGDSSTVAISVTGSGTISGTLNPGGIPFSGTAPTINVSVSPGSNTAYTVASLSDANCTALPGDLTGSRTVNVNTRPTASVSGSTTICDGGSASVAVSVTGTGTISGTLNPGGIPFSGTAPTINVSVSPSVSTAYTVATLSDASCTAQSGDLTGSSLVSVNPRPTGVLGGNQTICTGGTATLYVMAGGTGPFSGTLSPGAIPFSGAGPFITIDVTPAANTTYSLATLVDANCSSLSGDLTGTPTVTVHPLPTATISGTTSVCEGSSANITFSGTPDAMVTYTINGGANQTIMLDGAGSAILNTGAVLTNLTYALVSVDDFICQNSASGSAVITKTAVPEAAISGSTSICSGASTVISFVGTPSATVTYSVNGGPGTNLVLNGSGNGSLNTGVLVANTTYTLVSVTNGVCSQNIGSGATVTVVLNTYYQDSDNDGFGNPLVSTTGCTAPAGYVANDDDCCDSNADLNPLTEWWADVDGDGFGGFVIDNGCLSGVTCNSATWPANFIPYYPAAHGGAPYVVDCADSQPTVYPGATELCGNNTDDDCDGTIDEGCSGISNDAWVNATAMNTSIPAAVYPNCFNYNGTVLNADISAQGNALNVAPGGGRDVWYKFVAPSTAIQIKLAPNGFDGVIELQNSSAVQIDVENANNTIGGLEVLNIGSLTVGQTYYVGVRNYNATNVGTFSICASPMMPSGCALAEPVGGFALCTNYKALYRGANTYTFNFTGTGGTAPLVTTSATSSGLISLTTPALDIRYGGEYNVQVDAHFVVYNGVNAPDPTITVLGNVGSANCSGVSIMNQPNIEVRASQRCPATLNRNVYLHAVPVPGDGLVCGAVSYTYEFARVTDCTGATTLPETFTVTTANSSPFLILAAAFPSAQANIGYWNVRVRPNFGWGSGSFGPTQTIQISGTAASMMLSENEAEQAERMEELAAQTLLYPNPNNGDRFMLNLVGANEEPVSVNIYDSFGRIVHAEQFSPEGNALREIVPNTSLNSGFYTIEIWMNGNKFSERMVVTSK